MTREARIVTYTRETISETFPLLQTPGHGLHRSGVGGLSQRGRYHPTGRAADIFFNANDPDERFIGDRIFRMFRVYANDLGTDHVIWRRQIWSAQNPRTRAYGGTSPHTNHIHVFFTEAAAATAPTQLRTQVELIRDRWTEWQISQGTAARA